MLREELRDRPAQQNYLDHILTGGHRAADLTRQLLTFARQNQQQRIPMDLHEMVRETVAVLSRSIDKRIQIHQHLGAQARVVRGDPTQIQNALLNFGLNARDAMPEGWDLFIETRDIQLTA